jgi:NAD(P)H-nitrite reductase large subunit
MNQVGTSFRKGQRSFVIIGNGIAGVTAAETLRAEDASANMIMIANDPWPVYYRPALKDYLAGRVYEAKLWARPANFYREQGIHCIADRVVDIDIQRHSVYLQSGQQVGYSHLLLANGASAKKLACRGLDLIGVTTLRTIADYQAVLGRLDIARRIVVAGSGTLSLETVEVLRQRGHEVSHLLRHRTLWSEVLDATASDLVLQQVRRDGVDIYLEEEIAEIIGDQGQVTGVVTTKGTHIPCEMVLIAIGIEPNIDFIKRSGLACGRGVIVDSAMRTNAPGVYAAGDVVETYHPIMGESRLIGQWFPSVQQARAAVYSMLDMLDIKHAFHFYYNATFLYGLDFGAVGLTNVRGHPYQEIIADPKPRNYRKILLKDGIPVGMLSLGDRKEALTFKRAIDHNVNLLPILSSLFTENFKLADWLDYQGVPPPVLGISKVEETVGVAI